MKPGDKHYRAFVGPPEDFDVMAGLQFSLLFALGLREDDKLVDVGCGSLRAGRLLIPYLKPGNYYGLEPERWLVEEGIRRELGAEIHAAKQPTFRFADDFSVADFGVKFDYALAQSVFSHTYPDMVATGLRGIARGLAPTGVIVATFAVSAKGTWSTGSGWLYPECVFYEPEKLEEMMGKCGLVVQALDWDHPRQVWFLAGHQGFARDIEVAAAMIRPPTRR